MSSRRGFALVVGALLAPSGTAACNAIFSVAGYAGSGADAALEDGRVGPADARSDALGANDVVVPPMSDASAPDGCAGFCDNFDDRDADLQGSWTSFMTPSAPGVVAEISSTEACSKPHSAHFLLPTLDGGPGTGTYLTLEEPVPDGGLLTVDFDLLLAWNPSMFESGAFVNLYQILVDSLSGYGGALSLPENGGANFLVVPIAPDGAAEPQLYAPVSIPTPSPGVWNHVEIQEMFSSTAGYANIAVNGAQVGSFPAIETLPDGVANPTVYILLGLSSPGGTSPTELYLDNVVIH
jgi:hypothetical protein